MDNWLKITEFNWVLWIAGFFALLEFSKWFWTLIEWFVSKLGIETKHMRSKREVRDRLKNAELDINEIRKTAEKNVDTFLEHERLMSESFADVKNEIVQEIGKLHDKIDEQHERLGDIDKENKQRSAAILRDRLIQALRYFSQQKDENGIVHISMTDYENLNEMFAEYFNCNGNGVCHSLYENEFKKFKIDTERRY